MAKQPLKLIVQKLTPTAKLPTKNNATDAGIDFYSDVKMKIPGNSTMMVRTGIRVQIPKGYALQGVDRSGIASKTTLVLKAGLIDEEYRGELKIIFGNHGSYPIDINMGDKLAQFKLEKVNPVIIEEGEVAIDTTRGEQGFGSSDKEQ